MNGTEGIALQPVKSNASSTTGARKVRASVDPSGSSAVEDEKAAAGRGRGGRRKRMNTGLTRKDSGGDDVALNAMGRIYTRIVTFSSITRYLVYVAPVALLLAVPLVVLPLTGHRNDVPVGGTGGPPLFQLFLWIEVSWLSLWAGKMAASTLPSVFMFFSGVVSTGTRKYANVIRALEIPISLLLWALVSWLVFRNLFLASLNRGMVWVHNLERILASLLASSGVYLAEKAIVQLIAISYHQRSFALRIKESKREIHLLGLLYDASRTLFPMYCPEFADEDYVIGDSIEMLLLRGKNHQKNSSHGGSGGGGAATPMRLIGDVGRFGDKVTSVFGNLASEITGKKVFNPNAAHSVVIEALEKARSSEALARRIWMSFVIEGRESLYMDDFREVLGPAFKDEAEEAFAAIDADGNGDIGLDEMVRKVIGMGQERKAIGEGMKDISQALRVFDKVLLFVVLIIVVLIFLAFFQSSLVATIGTAATALLSLSFVFAVTTQEFLGSCIFLFVKHPYDVGDRVDISNGGEKMCMSVDKISLLYTVFTRIDKMKVVQIPNIRLNDLWIENVSRSKAMRELVTVNLSYDTGLDDIELLRLEMERFVRHPDNSRDFLPDVVVSVGGVGDLDKMELQVYIKHKSNWHNEMVRAARRSKFICALALALKKIPIYGPGGGGEALGGPGNPSYSVAVSDEHAAAARDKAAQEKEAKRLVPQTQPEGAAADLEAERKAGVELNAHKPVAEAYEGFGHDRADESTAATASHNGGSHRRSVDIESIRQDLKKSASQSGRRRPGEGIAPASSVSGGGGGGGADGQPAGLGFSTTGAPRSRIYDEEAQTGLVRTVSNASAVHAGGGAGTNYYNNATYQPYSLSPVGTNLMPHPLQQPGGALSSTAVPAAASANATSGTGAGAAQGGWPQNPATARPPPPADQR